MKRRSHILGAAIASLALCAGCGTGPETLTLVTTEDGKTVYESEKKYDGSRREMQFEHEGKTYFVLLYSEETKSPFTGKDKRNWHVELYRDKIGDKDAVLTRLIEEDPSTSGSLGGCGASFDTGDSHLRLFFGHSGSMMTARKACERVTRPSPGK